MIWILQAQTGTIVSWMFYPGGLNVVLYIVGFLVVVKLTKNFPAIYSSAAESYPDIKPYHWSDSGAI